MMNIKAKKALAGFAAAVTVLALSSAVAAPAVAAGDPPQDAVIKLISPVLTADNTSEAATNQKLADTWVTNGWFGTGLVFQRAFVPTGSTITLTYNVTDKNGKPLVGQDVKLRINKGYSNSSSILQVDQKITTGIHKPESADQAQVTHKTDAYGNVTFVMKNLDKPGTGEPEPESMTAKPNISADGLNDLHSQVLPEIAGEKPDHSVITEFHYYDPKTTVAQPATKPTIRLVSPALNDANSIQRADLEKTFSVDNPWYAKGIGFRQAYVQTGSAINLVYKVTDDNGKPLANTVVKLHVNKAYSASKAGMTDGTTATDATKDSAQGNDQALLTGTTDGFGYVLFALKNTDKKGEPIPASLTTPTPTTNGLFSQIYPEISGQGTDIADMVEFHFTGDAAVAAAPASTAVSVKATASKATVKGKPVFSMTVVIANASGKSAAISISGLKKVTEKISIANQAFKYTVSAGAKTVSVVIAGKTYTSKVTVK
jgi:protocatechuate 3,4-dioxygenase beta subunit